MTGKRSRKAVVALLAASLLAGCATEPGGLGPGATAAPGPTTPELAGVPWQHIRRPFYPLDDGPEPIFRA